MMDKPGVYVIRNTINDSFYIGSSKNISTRWYHHKRNALKGSIKSPYLYAAMRKYGIDNFDCKPLVVCEIEDLERYEQHFLDRAVGLDECYNVSKDVTAPMRRASAETRKKLSESISKSMKGKPAWNKGIPRTKEVRQKIQSSVPRAIDVSEYKNIENLYFTQKQTIKEISVLYEVSPTTIQRILAKHFSHKRSERRGGWNKGIAGSTKKRDII